MKKSVFVFVALLACFPTVFAQTPHEVSLDVPALLSATETYGTPIHTENDGKAHYLAGFSGMVFTLGLISSYNRFVSRAPWAQVGWDDIKDFDKKITWDKDWYWTNFVLHPYQGALTYMVARSANWNRIASFALTVVGDFAWEYLCETNSPSKNDLVYSSIGAFPVGEMLYRLSLEAEQVSRLLGYVVNPERLWTEWLTKQKPMGTTGNIYELALSVDMGVAYMYTNFGAENNAQHEVFPVIVAPQIAIVYNDPYGHDSNNPYSQFNLTIGFGGGAGSGKAMASFEEKVYHDIHIVSDGMLIARAPHASEHTDTTMGVVFEYDFFWNNMFQLSSLAPGVALKQRIRFDASDVEWQAHLAGILLGTTDISYLYRGKIDGPNTLYREYLYTVGAQSVLRWKWKSVSGYALAFDVHAYAMYAFENQKQDFDDTSWNIIGICSGSYEIPLSQRMRIGLQDQVYIKAMLYTHSDDMFQIANDASIYAKLQVK